MSGGLTFLAGYTFNRSMTAAIRTLGSDQLKPQNAQRKLRTRLIDFDTRQRFVTSVSTICRWAEARATDARFAAGLIGGWSEQHAVSLSGFAERQRGRTNPPWI
jgi:hypothetical protein